MNGLKVVSFGVVLAFLAYLLPSSDGFRFDVIIFIISLLAFFIGTIIHVREHFSRKSEMNERDRLQTKQPWDKR